MIYLAWVVPFDEPGLLLMLFVKFILMLALVVGDILIVGLGELLAIKSPRLI